MTIPRDTILEWATLAERENLAALAAELRTIARDNILIGEGCAASLYHSAALESAASESIERRPHQAVKGATGNAIFEYLMAQKKGGN